MVPSEEIRVRLTSLMDQFGTGAMASRFLDAMAVEDGVLAVGTDPDEWWDERNKLSRAVAAQTDELEGSQLDITWSQGWLEGQVGLAAAQADLIGPDGQSVPVRVTAAFAARDGEWKIVQWHASIGVENEVSLGRELTV